MAAAANKLVNHIFVGCGVPLKSMGWVHVEQVLAGTSRGVVSAVVEPWFMGGGKGTSAAFDDFRLNRCAGIPFTASVGELERPTEPTIAVISTRTADMPAVFKDCVAKGISHIYLEKPGAPTTAELKEMQQLAKTNGTQVMMGFNKNVCKYVQNALKHAEQVKQNGGTPDITFMHRNGYTRETLRECFERNSEGMLRNMAVHELALAVSLFNINPGTLAEASVDAANSEKLTIGDFTDFSSLNFTLKHQNGDQVRFDINRCGGQLGRATVNGTEFVCPDEEDEVAMKKLENEWGPELMGYFLAQWDDYNTLKNLLADHVAAGKEGLPEGVVTLDHAVDIMTLCDSLTAQFKSKL